MPPRPTQTARRPQTARSFPADSWTPDLIRQAELAADAGQLRWAAELCDALVGDDRIGACRDQLAAILGMPLEFEDGVGRARRKARRALEVEEDWWASFSDESLAELLWWGVHLGVGVGELLWEDRGGRLVPRLKVWHPRALRQDVATGQWFVRLADGTEEAVIVGDGRWVIFTPKSESAPWQHGGWRAASRWWRLKRYAMFDWGRACEQAAGLKVASTVDGADSDRDKLVEDLMNAGGDVALALPPGWTMDQLAMSASTRDVFDGLITTSNTAIAVRYLGQNLTTEVTGGSFAAAGVHATIASAILRALASALAACLRAQVLVPWALFNFGAEESAPWPAWPVDPPGDPVQAATTGETRVRTAAQLADRGVQIDWDDLAETHGFAVVAPWAKPTAPAAPLFGMPPAAASATRQHPGCGGSTPRPFVERKDERPIAGNTARPGRPEAGVLWAYRLNRDDIPGICPTRVCDDLRDIVRPSTDPWWDTHTPPMHFRCACYIEALPRDTTVRPTPDGDLDGLAGASDGFGSGAVPLATDDAARAGQLGDVATQQLDLPASAQGRPPRDGGTGEIYNPRLDAPARVVPGRSLEVGSWVNGPWPSPWSAWDRASADDRALAVLLISLLVWGAARTIDELLRERDVAGSEGARRIVDTEDGRLRDAILTERQ
jgi:phage gp29-like protein